MATCSILMVLPPNVSVMSPMIPRGAAFEKGGAAVLFCSQFHGIVGENHRRPSRLFLRRDCILNRTTPVIPQEEIRRQREFCKEIQTLNSRLAGAPTAYVDTYGCQQNEADSELIRGMLAEMGYEMTDTEQGADVIVINTCAIREHAEQRVLGNVGALVHGKRRNPHQII